MNKYLAVLLAVVLITPSVSFGWDSGCSASGPYSTLTGRLCGEPKNDCNEGDLFSSVTGEPCSYSSSLPKGCLSTFGYSILTGARCDNDASAVPKESPKPVISDTKSSNYSVEILVNPTHGEEEVEFQGELITPVDGIQVLVKGYHATQDLKVVFKDGDKVIEAKDKEESIHELALYFPLPIPVSDKTYTLELSSNDVTERYNVVSKSGFSNKYHDFLGNVESLRFYFKSSSSKTPSSPSENSERQSPSTAPSAPKQNGCSTWGVIVSCGAVAA